MGRGVGELKVRAERGPYTRVEAIDVKNLGGIQ